MAWLGAEVDMKSAYSYIVDFSENYEDGTVEGSGC